MQNCFQNGIHWHLFLCTTILSEYSIESNYDTDINDFYSPLRILTIDFLTWFASKEI